PPSTSTACTPAGLSSTKRGPRAAPSRPSQAATQRAPLPHWPEAEPSAIQMRSPATAPALAGGSMVRIWSQPTPVRRSARARQRSGAGGAAPSRRSITTKSLPAPCILVKRSGDRVITCRGVRGAVTATGSSGVVVRGQRSGRHAVDRRQGLVGTGRIAFRAFPGFVRPAGPVDLVHLL